MLEPFTELQQCIFYLLTGAVLGEGAGGAQILVSFSMYELKALEINVKKIIAVKDTWLMQLRKESLNFFQAIFHHVSCSEKSYSIRRVN